MLHRLDLQALKRQRQATKLTQKALARESGVPYSTLTKLEQGAIPSPSVDMVAALAEALSCTVSDLLPAKPLKIGENPRVKFVYFDVGGVLVHWLPSVHAFAERIGRSYDDVLQIFYEYNPLGCRGQLSLEELQLLFALKLQVDFKGSRKDGLRQAWIDDMRPIPAGHQLIQAVAKQYPVGLLTNVFNGYYPAFFDHGLVPKLNYQAMVKSCEVGAIKPERQIYKIAGQAAVVAPENILFIDDSRVNVQTARDFGWQAEWFDEFTAPESARNIMAKYFT